jgi:hypothetical protein
MSAKLIVPIILGLFATAAVVGAVLAAADGDYPAAALMAGLALFAAYLIRSLRREQAQDDTGA